MGKGSTFRAVVAVHSCLKDTRKRLLGKLKREAITPGEMRHCSVHIMFMAVEQE